jgi:hypothetical protein
MVHIECARHALSLSLTPNALALLQAPEALAAGTGTFVLCETLETILLRRGPGGKLAVDQDELTSGFAELAKRLAADTHDKFLRVRLLDMIEPPVAGSLGSSILLDILKQAVAATPPRNHRPTPRSKARSRWRG